MKTMRGRFFKKLKSLPNITSLRQGLFSQQHHPAEKFSYQNSQIAPDQHHKREHLPEELVDEFSVAEDFTDVEDGQLERVAQALHDDDVALSKGPTRKVPFDFQPPISSETSMEQDEAEKNENHHDYDHLPLPEFEAKCPPGGSESIILYTTTLRSIRKTFEECRAVRFLLASFKVAYYERDVSMHLEYREELWSLLGGRVIPPSLFIKGKYIGGADEVISLHERGQLKKLVQGIPVDPSIGHPCPGCGDIRFVVCSNCNGSKRVFTEEEDGEMGMIIRCPQCNENGLVKCSTCC